MKALLFSHCPVLETRNCLADQSGGKGETAKTITKVMNAHGVGDVVDTDLVRGNQRLSGQTTLEKAPSAQPPEPARTLSGVVAADVTRVPFCTESAAILERALSRVDSNAYNLCSFLRVTSFSFRSLTRRHHDVKANNANDRGRRVADRVCHSAGSCLLPNGQQAPNFKLNDLSGNSHKLSDYRGKVVVIDFFGWACGYCISDAKTSLVPCTTPITRRRAGQFLSVEVNGGSAAQIQGYLQQTGYRGSS